MIFFIISLTVAFILFCLCYIIKLLEDTNKKTDKILAKLEEDEWRTD